MIPEGLTVYRLPWRSSNPPWQVRHSKSGRLVMGRHSYFYRKWQAEEFARRLGELTDWTQDADEIVNQLEESEVRAIEDEMFRRLGRWGDVTKEEFYAAN